MERNDYIFGIRAVIEAIEAGRDIDKIFIKKEIKAENARELFELIRSHRILTQRVPVERIDRITRKNHQGVLAILSPVSYHRLDYLTAQLYEDGVLPFILLLDGITDVRNFGAIARTAEAAGVDAIVIPEHGSVSVGGDAVKTSAGALLRLPVCRERSILGAARFLKDNGYRLVAVTEKADINYTTLDYTDAPIALIMGSEDVGISEDVLRACDAFASIPMLGHIGSLNVSVAAGVMMYEVVRQRLAANLEVI